MRVDGVFGPMRPLQLPRTVTAAAVAAASVGALGVLPAAGLLQRAVTAAVEGRPVSTVARWAALSTLVQLATATVSLVGRSMTVRRSKPAVARLRRRLLRAQTRLPFLAVVGSDPSVAHTVVITDAERLESYAEQVLGSVLPGTLLLLTSVLYVAARDPMLAVGCGVVAVPVLGLTLAANRMARRASVRYWAALRTMNGRVLRFLRMQHLYADLGLEDDAVRSEEPSMLDFERVAATQAQAHGVLVHGQTMVFAAGAAGLLVIAASVLGSGRSDTGTLLSILYALVVGQSAARMITGAQAYLMAGRDAAPRVVALLEEAERFESRRGGMAVERVRRLELRDVSFGYGDELLLRNLSVVIDAGECVVVVGPNGVGKSTLLRLLTGRVAPLSGAVLVDGVSLDDVDLASLRRRIGLVSQSAPFADGSVRDNLRLVDPDADEPTLRATLDLVGLRSSLDHVVGEDAALLSGGQRQRLALARALLRSPDVVLLDEPGNHLDEDTAGLIERVRSAHPGLTIVVVSHDRSALEVPGARVVELVRH